MEIMSNNYYNYMLLDPRKPTKWTEEYAHCTVINPEEHQDAVEAIIDDYTSGALKAYELLTSKNE